MLNQLSDDFDIHIKSKVPESLFSLGFKKPFRYLSQPVDTGCCHSDSLEVDAEETFKCLVDFQNHSWVDAEKKWLQENQVDIVLSDVASMPLKAAHELGIPSILIGNFTWHDIYCHLPGADKHKELLETLAEDYNCADLQILPQCHLPPPANRKSKEVGFLAQNGQSRRKELEQHLEISFEDKTLVFIYLGLLGTDSVKWEKLAQNKECLFLTRDPIKNPPSNLYRLDDRFTFPDLIASVDVVCTKGGYSTIGSAFTSHKPVITCERHDFYEFMAIREYLSKTQTGVIIEDEDFYRANWDRSIKTALSLTVKDKVPLNGEIEILETLHKMLS